MQDLKLIAANQNDIKKISELAAIIWNQHYPGIIGQNQLDYMLNLMYSPQSLSEQLISKRHIFYLINSDAESLGFISVNEEKKGEWFLNKFYINQTKAAKGIGTRAFGQLVKIIKPNKITLTVNRQNYKSINFYFKLGFVIEKVANFDIGNGFTMDDFVMSWARK
jgi:ribosomal protein S18 acetylase RimI-like enzyme